jgi:hypothetical protein
MSVITRLRRDLPNAPVKVSSKCDDEDRSDVGVCQSAFEGNLLAFEPIVTECEFSIVMQTFFKDVHELNQYMDTVFLKRYLYTFYIIVNIGRAIYSDKSF